jgi:hypothetical protein
MHTKFWWENLKGKRVIPKYRGENNIRLGNVEWTHVAQDRNQQAISSE